MNDKSYQRWGKKEIDFLNENYRGMSLKEIGRELGRTRKAVAGKCYRLGLKKESHQKWSKREIDFLKENYRKITYEKIGEKLGRRTGQVGYKCRALGLKNWSVQKWTEREIKFLKKNHRKMTHEEMGKKLGRTRGSIIDKCHVLGLKKRTKIVVNREPTPDLAYVLGVCKGDGCVTKSKKTFQYSIALETIDKEFAVSFREALENIGLRPYNIIQRKRGPWIVCAQSKDFYNWYHSLNYKDIGKILVTKKMKKEFIRGFYESDGSFHRKGRRWDIKIHNVDLELLKFIEELLNCLGFKTGIYEEGFGTGGGRTMEYALCVLGGCREVIRFLQEINPCIPRKSLEKVDFSDRRGLMRPVRRWNGEEEEFMRKNYLKKKMTVKRISKILERSEGAVMSKAYQMGLNKFTKSSH